MTFRLYLDRFEGELAVLLLEEKGTIKEILLPRDLLPPGTGEGEVMRCTLERDREETERMRAEIENLRSEMKNQRSEM
ncbi:MAG TPA: DUF3006 domain-containing protein [Cyanobacteria bacterium UBA8530]|nr:DUF3006 domain-containing protein [Cyanobacteria bacterium UBA8530]